MNSYIRTIPRRKTNRLRDHDYTHPGIYFVTICAHESARLFGRVIDGAMRLNELGCLVEHEWRKTAIIRPTVELDLYVVMPNHFHGLVCIANSGAANRDARRTVSRSNSLGAIVGNFKAAVTKASGNLAFPPPRPIWQRGYHDHIVRGERELEHIQRYIIANPAKWQADRYYGE